MSFSESSAENKSGASGKLAPDGCLSSIPSDEVKHPKGEGSIPDTPAGHNFPQSAAFLWQVLNDMGLVETARTLRGELSTTGISRDILSSPFIPTNENTNVVGLTNLNTTEIEKALCDQGIEGMGKRKSSFPSQHPPRSIFTANETEPKPTPSDSDTHTDYQDNSSSNISFRSLLERVLREKLGEDEQKTMKIVQVLSYYTVEPLSGALSSLERVRRGTSGSTDDVMNSVGQVNLVVNALSDLYDHLTAVALANTHGNGLTSEKCEKTAFPLSSLPSVLKKVFLLYCNILLLQQNIAENVVIGDIASKWNIYGAQSFRREGSSQLRTNAVTQEDLASYNGNDDGTKRAESTLHHVSSNGERNATGMNGKAKPRKKRRASLSTKSTTHVEVYDSNNDRSHSRSVPLSSVTSNGEEKARTTKARRRCFHPEDTCTTATAQSLMEKNVLLCACQLVSCTQTLHMTLEAHHAHLRSTKTTEVSEGNTASDDRQKVDRVAHVPFTLHGSPAIELVEQALELMHATNGLWKRRAELVLRWVLQRSSLHCSLEASGLSSAVRSPNDSSADQGAVESRKGSPVDHKAAGFQGVNEWQGVLSSIRVVEDACRAPAFQETNELDVGVPAEESEMHMGMEAHFLPRCPFCDYKQGGINTSKEKNEDAAEDEESRADHTKISFIRIWHAAERARNILWMLQSAEEHVRFMHLSTRPAHCSDRQDKALEEAISVWEGQWTAHCANVLEQTLLVQHEHGGATSIKDDTQDKNKKVEPSSSVVPFHHLEYRRHRYERLFTTFPIFLSPAEGEKTATQKTSRHFPVRDPATDEDPIHTDGAAASDGRPCLSSLSGTRRSGMTDKDMRKHTLWDVFLNGVYALTDGFFSAAVQLLLDGQVFDIDTTPSQCIGGDARIQGDEAFNLPGSVTGLGDRNKGSPLVVTSQEKRSRVQARLFSNFMSLPKMGKVGLPQTGSYHPFESSACRGFHSCSERRAPLVPLFAEKDNASEVFPYAVDLSITYKATPEQTHGLGWKEGSKQGRPFQDMGPDDRIEERGDAMKNALRAVMRSLQSGFLVDGLRQSRGVRPLRQRLRRVLAHQHIILDTQTTGLPLRLQMRALQNPKVLEALGVIASEKDLIPGAISKSLPNEENDNNATHNQTTDKSEAVTGMPDNRRNCVTDEAGISVDRRAALMPTLETVEITETNTGVLPARMQTIPPVHLSITSRNESEEGRVVRGTRRRQGVFQGTRISSTISAIRRIAQDIGITVERVIMTPDVENWDTEGRVETHASISLLNTLRNALNEEEEGYSPPPPPPRQQTPPYRLTGTFTDNTSMAEEEDSAASDASSADNHFNQVSDEIMEEVQQVTVTPCGTLMAFVTTCARLVVYALRAHVGESTYREELLVDTVLPGTPKRPHWYEAHSTVVGFSPDGRFVMAAVQFTPRGVAKGAEEEESRVIPASTGQICIYSLHKERHGAAPASTTPVQQGLPRTQRQPFKRLFQLPNRLYAIWKIHSAPVTTAQWADPRFWGGGWVSPQDVFLHLNRKDASARDAAEEQSFATETQGITKNAVDNLETCDTPLHGPSRAWHIAARARLAVFQCFSTALDDLIIRWLPCSGVVVQRIAATSVQDLIISPLTTALYTIDDKGLLSMYDVWNEAEVRDTGDLGYLSSEAAAGISAQPTILIGDRGLPISPELLQTPEESFDLSSRRRVKLGEYQEFPRAFFYGTRIIRFNRSGITARHGTSPGNLTGADSISSLSLPMAAQSSGKATDSGAGAVNYLSRFLRHSVTGATDGGENFGASGVGDGSLFLQGMASHRSAQIGHKLIQSVLAAQVSSPSPNSVIVSSSSTSTLRLQTSSESEEEEEEYQHDDIKGCRPAGPACVYPLSVENETGVGDGLSSRRVPQAVPSQPYRDATGMPNAFYKSGSRLVFSEIGRALCLAGNITPVRHDAHNESRSIPYRLLSLALSGKPQWGSVQQDGDNHSEEAMYHFFLHLSKSRKMHGLNSHQSGSEAQDLHEGNAIDNSCGNAEDVTDIGDAFSISYFTDYHSRGSMAHDDRPYTPYKRTCDDHHHKTKKKSDPRAGKVFGLASRSVRYPELHLEPTARNGRYLALMASIGPNRALVDRSKPLEHRPGLYGCLIFDIYMSFVVRVVKVCPLQPVVSLSRNGTISAHNSTVKTPIFSLQCSLTVIGPKPVGSRGDNALPMRTDDWYRDHNPGNSIEGQKSRMLGVQRTEEDYEKIILTVGGLHNTLYIFDALSGDRIRTVTLQEANFARIFQASRTNAMGGTTARNLREEKLHGDPTISPSQPGDRSNSIDKNYKGIATTKHGKTGEFRHMRGANSKISVEEILYSLSTWDRFDGPNKTSHNKAESNMGIRAKKATTVANDEGLEKIWSHMAGLSEDDHIWITSGNESEIERKDSNEEVPKMKGGLELRSRGVRYHTHKSRHWLIDQLVQRYGLPLVLYAHQRLTSVIYWPSELGESLLSGSQGNVFCRRNHLEKVPQGENRAPCSKIQRQNLDSQTLFSLVEGETGGRMSLTKMSELSRHLCVGEASQKYRNALSGRRDHLDKLSGGAFHTSTACFDEPFKFAMEQLTELSQVMCGTTQSGKFSNGNSRISPLAEMVFDIYRGNPLGVEAVTQNESSNNCDMRGSRYSHVTNNNSMDSDLEQPEGIFEGLMDNLPNGNNNTKLLHCGVVNTVAAWWSGVHSGASSQRNAFHVLAGTESGKLHIIGGFL